MSISHQELLAYAESLYEESLSEVHYRACVGRAYYAAMLKCRDYHSSLRIEETSRRHAVLIKQLTSPRTLNKSLAAKLRKIGLDLKGMKLAREEADYDTHLDVSKEDALDAIERAQIIFEELA